MSLDATLKARIITAGLANADFTSTGAGWLVIPGGLSDRQPVLGRPQLAIVLTGGMERGSLHNGGSGVSYPQAQILARGLAHDYEGARDKIEAVATNVHNTPLAGSGETSVVFVQTEPLWLGYQEESGRPMWSLNVRAATV